MSSGSAGVWSTWGWGAGWGPVSTSTKDSQDAQPQVHPSPAVHSVLRGEATRPHPFSPGLEGRLHFPAPCAQVGPCELFRLKKGGMEECAY